MQDFKYRRFSHLNTVPHRIKGLVSIETVMLREWESITG